jgi:predicted methyltransferase
MKRHIGLIVLSACTVLCLWVAVATGQDQHGAQSRDAIDKMRDRDLQPERIVDVIGLRPGMTVGEAGASYGYFTFKMSRRVGPTGMVYANDIAPGALESIEKRFASEKVGNIKTVLGEEVDPRFPRNDLDMIVVFDCLFEFSQQALWMTNARKYLKPGGRLVIVDPDRSKLASAHFLSRQQIHDFARESGYTVVGADDAFLKTHMIVVLQAVPRGEKARDMAGRYCGRYPTRSPS